MQPVLVVYITSSSCLPKMLTLSWLWWCRCGSCPLLTCQTSSLRSETRYLTIPRHQSIYSKASIVSVL